MALRGGDLVGYYALSMTQVLKEELPPGAGWRRMPRYPIGAILLGRLAVDRRWQSHGYGTDLLVAACVDAVTASKLVAARYLVVDALNEAIVPWWESKGFLRTPNDPQKLLVRLDDIVEALRHAAQ